jgi:hypothetical protein
VKLQKKIKKILHLNFFFSLHNLKNQRQGYKDNTDRKQDSVQKEKINKFFTYKPCKSWQKMCPKEERKVRMIIVAFSFS